MGIKRILTFSEFSSGDSDDEDEDRENLVGAVEDSDDEENERQATKKRNYELLRVRASKRKGL